MLNENTNAIVEISTETTVATSSETIVAESVIASSETTKAAATKTEEKEKLPYKSSRWVKVHKQGEANFESKNNVMDITVGENRCQAEATYTSNTRTFEKAAYWLLRYLGHAEAKRLLEVVSNEIEAKAKVVDKDTEEISMDGEGWSCTIEKLDKGIFKTQLTWAVEKETSKSKKSSKKQSDK